MWGLTEEQVSCPSLVLMRVNTCRGVGRVQHVISDDRGKSRRTIFRKSLMNTLRLIHFLIFTPTGVAMHR